MNSEFERHLHGLGCKRVAGVDEAGRGPLAGPVVAAAVVFRPGTEIPGVDDSKKLSPVRREELYAIITREALGYGVGVVDHKTIDRVNILNATFDAMHQALGQLLIRPDHVLVDGNRFKSLEYSFTTIVDGDARCFSIAAASIIAKVWRDRLMVEFDKLYPGYGFARHKGYGTPQHLRALAELGASPIHRLTFLKSIMVREEGP
ncbi:MAG TPA: ribonuclease HII [Bacteroidota bacterium]|nr:ribonuclease HII [Bacteroidota bacterium]